MIRDALSSSNTMNGHASSTAQPSSAGVDGEATPKSQSQDASKLQKLGGILGNAASNLGHSLGIKDDQVNEIMIGMFMHTPWPSSEIFRCLPSRFSFFFTEQ
jgi:trehalose 6-phosphate synthase/phosphatase